jgi:hypothetical protein
VAGFCEYCDEPSYSGTMELNFNVTRFLHSYKDILSSLICLNGLLCIRNYRPNLRRESIKSLSQKINFLCFGYYFHSTARAISHIGP